MARFIFTVEPGGETEMTQENISSQCNGSRTTFTVNANFVSSSLRVYYNGVRQTGEFTVISDNQFSLSFTPDTGDRLEIDYITS